MPKAPLFDLQGKRAGEADLAEDLFGRKLNKALIHQKVVMEENAQRQGTSDTKGRSEVRGGGRKPYRQKGTGRARQGTIRAPHYRHGGIVFGPTPRDFTQNMPRKMKQAALKSALSAKASAEQVLIIEDFSLTKISTREAAVLLDSMDVTGKALVVVEQPNEMLVKSMRNIPGVELRSTLDLSTRDVMNGGQIVITRAALAKMEELWAR